ncbi:porin [Paraburkholderia silvatlantica]|uniref:Porin n=1 Tax=Paraburkholderia silvatlantica TaxID=321895 RepID=A0ABR6FVR5_9BURK|nr:porin [Paraburkholderia silvatlantica]MBB2931525.1 putative porin [Paraburkholderia silvatlantica]PVY27811.1 putative porin [Paraburkholderia silvatlantica]PXW34658.1 putative porin [Paraburkholderia silvatlantica]TDQ98500.1 putative porin [Paraburkholderia silvatlantica]
MHIKQLNLEIRLIGVAIAFASPAIHAQSVRLSGSVDAGIAYVSDSGNANGHQSAWQAKNGDINISRWILSGTEPLSSDLTAIFTLTNGFSVMNGNAAQQGRLFGFQAWMGLTSQRAGSLTMGRQFDEVVQFVEPFSLGGTSYGGAGFAHVYDNDNLDNYTRINNSVKYVTPLLGGVKLGALYGFSNAGGEFANNRAYSFGFSYQYGNLDTGAGYFQLDHASNLPTANTNGAVPAGAPFNAERQRTWAAGGLYHFGRGGAGLVISETRLDNATSINNVADTAIRLTGDDVRFDNVEVNVRYYVTLNWNVSAGYTFTLGRFATPTGVRYPKWHQAGIVSTYFLSPSTDVYVETIYQRANQLQGTGIQGAQISNFSRASGANQLVAAIGLRHRF